MKCRFKEIVSETKHNSSQSVKDLPVTVNVNEYSPSGTASHVPATAEKKLRFIKCSFHAKEEMQ